MKKTIKGLVGILTAIFIFSTINSNCLADEIRFNSPQLNETWYRGETHEIDWDEPKLIYSNLWREQPYNVSLRFSTKTIPATTNFSYLSHHMEEIKMAEITAQTPKRFEWAIPLDLPRSIDNQYTIHVEFSVFVSNPGVDTMVHRIDSGERVITILDPGEEQMSNSITDDSYWLSRAIMSEASIGTQQEQIAVGWVALNRLHIGNQYFYYQPSETMTAVVAYGFAYNQEPTQQIINLANELLEGKYPDPTGGALYFFSPRGMPKEGEDTQGYDVGGGIHTVPGTTDKVYFPSWAKPTKEIDENTKSYQTTDQLEWEELNNINNWYFMFYHPISSQYAPEENGEPNDSTITGTSTDGGTPGFEMIFLFLAVTLVLFWKRKSKNL